MATDIANLRVKIGGDVSGLKKGMRGALLQVEALKVGIRAAGKALGAMTRFMGDAAKAAGVQEAAMVNLTAALGRAGEQAAGQAAQDFAAFASELQSMTKFGDEVTIQAASIAASFGITGDALEETTRAATDLATVTGQDLKSAMILLGKAAKGETGTLSRYGIIIDQNLPRSERFKAALQAINQQFGGAAQAAAQTYEGRVAQLGNTWGDFKEALGATLTSSKLINAALGVITRTIQDMSGFVTQNASLIQQWIEVGWNKLFGAIDVVIRGTGFFVKMLQGLKIVGTTVLLLLAKGWKLQIEALELLLTPLTKVFDGMVALGLLDFNPLAAGFEKVNGVLETAIESFSEVLDDQLKGYEKIDPAIKGVRDTVAGFKKETLDTAKAITQGYNEGVVPAIDAAGDATKKLSKEMTLQAKAFDLVRSNAEAIGQGFATGNQEAKEAIRSTIAALAAEAAAAAAAKMFASAPPFIALLAAPLMAGLARGMVMRFANFDTGGVVPDGGGAVAGQRMAVVRDNEKIVPTGGPPMGRDGPQIVINQQFPTNRAELDKQVRDVILPALHRVGAF